MSSTNRELLSQGFKKLYTAELLTMAGAFSSAFTGKMWYVGLVLVVFDIAAYFMTIKAAKTLAKGDKNFHNAHTFAIVGLIAGIVYVISGALNQFAAFENISVICDAGSDVCEVLVTIFILTGAEFVLIDLRNEKLAKEANSTKVIFIVGWALSQLMIIISGNDSVGSLLPAAIAGVLSVVFLLFGEIKFLLFLKKAQTAF